MLYRADRSLKTCGTPVNLSGYPVLSPCRKRQENWDALGTTGCPSPHATVYTYYTVYNERKVAQYTVLYGTVVDSHHEQSLFILAMTRIGCSLRPSHLAVSEYFHVPYTGRYRNPFCLTSNICVVYTSSGTLSAVTTISMSALIFYFASWSSCRCADSPA